MRTVFSSRTVSSFFMCLHTKNETDLAKNAYLYNAYVRNTKRKQRYAFFEEKIRNNKQVTNSGRLKIKGKIIVIPVTERVTGALRGLWAYKTTCDLAKSYGL